MENNVTFAQESHASISIRDMFPLDTLPSTLHAYVSEVSESLPADPVMVALPVLVTVAAAIGNSRSIRIKQDWIESAALYGAIVADAGSMKSPALAKACEPLQTLQKVGTRRFWASDTTVEALAVLLQENPRGLVLIHDELSSWVLSLNQYKKGGQGNDKQFYLTAWSGNSVVVDRKTANPGGSKFMQIDKPFISVIGAIPPDVLAALKEDLKLQDGFIHRLLFAWPSPVPVRLTDRVVSEATHKCYVELIKNLTEVDWPSEPYPQPLDLRPDAYRCFQEWHDVHMAEPELPDFPDHLKGFWAKLKGYCARLALVHAIVSDSTAEAVTVDSVIAAIGQIEYFKGQTIRIGDRIGLSVGTAKRPKVEQCKEGVIRTIQRKGPSTKRDIQRVGNCSADLFNAAWESLFHPELITLGNGTVTFSNTSIYRQTDTPLRLVEGGTDRPTANLNALEGQEGSHDASGGAEGDGISQLQPSGKTEAMEVGR